MIDYNLDAAHSILCMRPTSALAAEDFVKIAEAVDPHIEATGGLAGVIIEVPEFTRLGLVLVPWSPISG